MKLTTLHSDEVDFIWYWSHYDVHLEGLCKYDGNLCRFEHVRFVWEEDEDGDLEIVDNLYDIFSLTLKDKIKLKLRQWKFELCVGKHCSYPHRENGVRYKSKRPIWLHKILLWWQYGRNKL